MSSIPVPIHDCLTFAARRVEQLEYASHTTERNAQQCLLIWDRCREILEALRGLANGQGSNPIDADSLEVVTAFDGYVEL